MLKLTFNLAEQSQITQYSMIFFFLCQFINPVNDVCRMPYGHVFHQYPYQ